MKQKLTLVLLDLKKIIKYEHRRRKHLAQNEYNIFFPTQSADNYSEDYTDRQKSPVRVQKPDIFETLHNLPTEAFKAKIVNKKDKQQPIAIHIKQTKKKSPIHEHCIHIDKLDIQPILSSKTSEDDKNLTDSNTKKTESNLGAEKKDENKTDGSKNDLEIGSSRTSGLRPNSKQSQSSSGKSTKMKKPQTQGTELEQS